MITAKLLLAYLLQAATIANPALDQSTVDLEQAYCLAENVYYESRNEDIRGQFAVAAVTLNRANDARFPDTVCDVVKFSVVSKVSKKRVCAFSWYCEKDRGVNGIPFKNKDGSINQPVVDQFQVAAMVAIASLTGQATDNTNGATHFHNPFVSFPSWRHEMKKTMRVGNHDFYRMPK